MRTNIFILSILTGIFALCNQITAYACSGTSTLTSLTDTLSDGSGSANYSDNSDCYWLIQPGSDNIIQLTFSTFETELNYDLVRIYDGSDTNALLLGTFSGTSLPSTLTSSGSNLLIRFTTNYSKAFGGWQAWYKSGTCFDTMLVKSASGLISDGSSTSDYSNNLDCKWLIQPDGAVSIIMDFLNFNTESSNDVLKIYDGPNASANLIGSYSGTNSPPTITSTTGSIFIHFSTNSSVTSSGWSALYQSIYCDGTTNLTDASGSFGDGSSSGNYLNNSDCKWLIQPPNATSITLDFTSFLVEPTNDLLKIYDGIDTTAQLIGSYSGYSKPSRITSSHGSLFLHFSTNNSLTTPGWEANYYSGYCSGNTTLTASQGTFEDGSGINNYGPDNDCYWLIQPGGAEIIILNFNSFETEQDVDFVIIYDGPDTTAAQLAKISGTTLPSSITSSGVSLLIRFITNSYKNFKGWQASYETGYCFGTTIINDAEGTVFDGSGTENYKNNADCKWIIQSATAESINLEFSSFNTETNVDYVRVYDGADLTSTLLGEFSGSNLPPLLKSTGGSLLINFVSNSSINLSGFEAKFSSNFCSGTTTFTETSGSFDDHSGNYNYMNNANCKWLIQPAGAESISLEFKSFETDSGYDFVNIYDAVDTSATLLGSFSGASLPTNIVSSTGIMLVHFISDNANSLSGWEAEYNAGYCNGTTILTESSGTFEDGSGMNNYSPNSDCKWLIQPGNASFITLNFDTFRTEKDYDIVKIYDGDDTTAALLGIHSGSKAPPTIVSTGGAMLVRFLTNDSKNLFGWSASYSQTINAVAKITSSANGQCLSDTFTFTDSSYGDIETYQWNFRESAGVVESSLQGPHEVQYSASGLKIVTLTVSGKGGTDTDTIFITVYDPPPIPSIQISGDSLNCSDSGIYYQWYFDDEPILNANSPTYIITENGLYSVEIFNIHGCSSSSTPIYYFENSIDENNFSSSISLFPNPNSGTFTLKFSDKIEKGCTVRIYDIMGKELINSNIDKLSEGQEIHFTSTDLQEGIYLIEILTTNRRIVKHFEVRK